MSIAQAGVYLPFKSLLQGSGIQLVETATSITVGTTGAGPGGGDMLSSQYATNGQYGIVDKALVANGVPWGGVTGVPLAFTPVQHEPTHMPGGTDALPLATPVGPGFLAKVSGNASDYVGGDNLCHALPSAAGGGDDSTPPTTPSAYDDEFTSPTLNPKWVISGSKALVTANLVGNNFLQLAYQYGATGIIALRATESVNTAAGFGFQIKMRCIIQPYDSGVAGSTYYAFGGFGLVAGTHSIAVFLGAQTTIDATTSNDFWYTNYLEICNGAGSANPIGGGPLTFSGADIRFKIWNDISAGTPGQLSIAMSTDAINWLLIYTEPFTGASLKGTFPNSLFLDVDSAQTVTAGDSASLAAFDYVRKIS